MPGIDAEHRVVGFVLRRDRGSSRARSSSRLDSTKSPMNSAATPARWCTAIRNAGCRRRCSAWRISVAVCVAHERRDRRGSCGRTRGSTAPGRARADRRAAGRAARARANVDSSSGAAQPLTDRSARPRIICSPSSSCMPLGPVGQRRAARRGRARRATALRGNRTARPRAARRRRSTSRSRRSRAPSRTARPGAPAIAGASSP